MKCKFSGSACVGRGLFWLLELLAGDVRLIRFLYILCCWAVVVSAAENEPFEKSVRPVLEKYCFECHGLNKTKGKVNLVQFEKAAEVGLHDRLWLKVVEQLETGEMPPEDEPQPSDAERKVLIKEIGSILRSFDFSKLPPDPGHVGPHRLNRIEYANTIRDLFGVKLEAQQVLPADGGGGEGFDNTASTLFLTPVLLEIYLELAEKVVGEALGKAPKDRVEILRIPQGDASSQFRTILNRVATAAYRRVATPEELADLIAVGEKALKTGGSVDQALQVTLPAVLVSPNFLFRSIARKEGDKPWALTDFELATRLSYFLWSSAPDRRLLELARAKKLRNPQILADETRRMLRDSRADVFFERFTSQWLKFDALYTTVWPDHKKYPNYRADLRDDLYREPIAMFKHVTLNNLPMVELVSADYTFVNWRLAKHYGMSPVKGEELRKVASADGRRGGILTMGAVLTATSFPRRTSPVLRGKWVLDEVLGAEVPPPPTNVAGLPADDHPKDGLSLRQRLEAHRDKPECAACHRKMDPIGFGLENYDVTGRWRDDIHGEKVEPSGKLPTGESFAGPAELRKILGARRDAFARNFVERLLAYGLGRGIETYDTPAIRSILEQTGKQKYRMEDSVIAVVQSYPFTHQRNVRSSDSKEKVSGH